MTLLTFTFGALPLIDDERGTHIIHMWLDQLEPTRTDNPGDERRAAKDAAQVIRDIIGHNRAHHTEEDMKLLAEGTIPPDVLPIFVFAIGVNWDRANKMPAYKAFDYATVCSDPKFHRVAHVGRELYDYTLSVLKRRETADRTAANVPKFAWDRITIENGRRLFVDFQRRVVAAHVAFLANRRRAACPNLKSGFCSPIKPGCPCYRNGRCEEVSI